MSALISISGLAPDLACPAPSSTGLYPLNDPADVDLLMRKCLSCSGPLDPASAHCLQCGSAIRASSRASQPSDDRTSGPASRMEAGCPVCGRRFQDPDNIGLLYLTPVCRDCRNDFAARRLFAQLIDAIVWVLFPLFIAGTFRSFGPARIIAAAAFLLAAIGFLLKDGFGGSSMGKSVMGLAVVNRDTGLPIGKLESLIRNLPLYIPFAAIFMAAGLKDGPRLGDNSACTIVISVRESHRNPFRRKNGQPFEPEFKYSSRLGRV